MPERVQGSCKLVSCSHHEDGGCENVRCVLTDEEYAAEVSREEWIEYYETRERDQILVGRSVG